MNFRAVFLFPLLVLLIGAETSLAEGITFSDPVMVDTATGDFRQPSLTASTHSGLLYLQYVKEGSASLRAYQIYVRKGLSVSAPEEMLEDSPNPYRPNIKSVGDRKLLYWYQDNSGTEVPAESDVIMQHRVVFFDGIVPTEEELTNQCALLSGKLYWRRPLFLQIDSTLFINVVEELNFCNYYGWCSPSRFRLRSINVNNESVTSLDIVQETQGTPALIAHGDTLVYVYSSGYCVGVDGDWCYERNGYLNSAFFLDGGLLQRSTLWAVEYERHFGSLPTDVCSGLFDGEYILGARSMSRLASIDYDRMTLSEVADLAPYASSDLKLPIQCGQLNVVLTPEGVPRILVLDREWNFIDSASFPLGSTQNEFSEFVYLPVENKIVFAYSSYVPDGYASDRVFIQSISFDFETDTPNHPASSLPERFALSQNYPNPFNPSTSIQFSLAQRSEVTISIYNVLGQKVRTLLNETRPAGSHTVLWNGTDESDIPVASGIYLYRLKAGDFDQTKKMLLLK